MFSTLRRFGLHNDSSSKSERRPPSNGLRLPWSLDVKLTLRDVLLIASMLIGGTLAWADLRNATADVEKRVARIERRLGVE